MIARVSTGALDPQCRSRNTAAYQYVGASDYGDLAAVFGNQLVPNGFHSSTGHRRAASKAATGRRQWVERAGATSATTPMWTSRSAWLDALRLWANHVAVRELCVQLGCSINAATLVGIAAAMADYADHATGRYMAATRATLAAEIGCSPRTITTAWRVLQAAHWIVLAAPGRGNAQTPSRRRRPAIWHLTPRRRVVDDFHLPARNNFPCVSPVGNYSPSAHARSDRNSRRAKPRCGSRCSRPPQPRPLGLQRLAAQLAVRTHGIDRRGRHIGGVCDAIVASGIDVEAWTAAALKAALEADMRATGWTWPDRITSPAGFLVSRLRRLPTRPPESPSSDVISAANAVSGGSPRTPRAQSGPIPPPALTSQQRARIAQVQQQCRQALETSRRRRKSEPPNGPTRPHGGIGRGGQRGAVATLGSCVICDSDAAPLRPYLPLSRAHVCEDCWEE